MNGINLALRALTTRRGALTLTPLLHGLRDIHHGSLTLIDADELRHHFRGETPGPSATLRIHRPAPLMRQLLLRGAEGFAESYLDGDWETPGLRSLLQVLALNAERLSHLESGSTLARWRDRAQHLFRRNSRRGSRRNIAYHYDLGNDFYRLWLDETMTYSAACFERPGEDLAAAQRRKIERMLALTGARPGDHLLEIGCGWGGFAIAAARAGCRVTGITLSTEQLAWARRAVHEAGVEDRVELRLQDYRDLDERFDHIVSIEMFEAVGERYWPGYFQTLKRCLKPGGRAAMQVITIDEACFERYRESADFIQLHIFPGGMLPSIPVFDDHAARAGLRPVRRDTFGADYAETLRQWDQRVHAATHRIEAQGYDERFLRLWHYYLAYCEAGFRTGRIDVMQVALEHRP
ncbi:MAG: cyclopropane-fatty-acyl-phospholipid synthase family protein [Gammaproteobacteria bacterium]